MNKFWAKIVVLLVIASLLIDWALIQNFQKNGLNFSQGCHHKSFKILTTVYTAISINVVGLKSS